MTVTALDRRFYPHLSDNWDNRLLRRQIEAEVTPGAVVLDLGAGAGIVPEMDLRALGVTVIGVDPDPRVLENPYLDVAHVARGEALPLANESVDLAVACNVLEPLPDPLGVFREVRRVLRPGGAFLAKTPNRWHYVPLIASLTPHRFHQWVNEKRGRSSADTYPTLYRANSPGRIRQLARKAGFSSCEVRCYEGRPEYLRFHPLLYLAGVGYERLVNRFSALQYLRVVMIAAMRR